MNQLNILNEAKKAKSVDELKQMALDNSVTLTDEKAEFYFSLVNETKGELSPEDLDAATGGVDNAWSGPNLRGSSHCFNWKCSRCGAAVISPSHPICSECKKATQLNSCRNCAQWISGGSHQSCSNYLNDGTTSGC